MQFEVILAVLVPVTLGTVILILFLQERHRKK